MEIVKKSDVGLAKMPLLYPELRAIRASAAHQKIALPTAEGLCFEKIENILFMVAEGNYTTIYFQDGRHTMVCKTLSAIEAMLNNLHQFVRIHRSHTINLNWLKKYVRGKGGYVVMENGENMNVSASRKNAFMEAIERYF